MTEVNDDPLAALKNLASAGPTISLEDIEDFLLDQPELKGRDIVVRALTDNLAAGASGGTLLFNIACDGPVAAYAGDYVLRFDLGDDGIFSQTSLSDQFAIMRALHARGLPVPDALWNDPDRRVVPGAGALIMRRVHARAPNIQYLQRGIFAEADEAKQESMIMGLMRVVARLHALDLDDLALPTLETRGGAGQHFIDREINWALQELRARFPDHEEGERAGLHTEIRRTLEETAPVLRSHAPRHRKAVLAHGDVTIANTMYNEDGAVVALLDWELSHHGLPEADVAYFLSAAAGGIAHMGGAVVTMPTLDRMIAYYEAAGGRGEDWEFGAAFAAYRVATWGAIGMRRMPKPFWPAQLSMWEHHRDGLADAMRTLTGR